MRNKKALSIIIPVLNEASVIEDVLGRLSSAPADDPVLEIIVVDGGSSDETVELARRAGVRVITSPKGRARQMNAGAAEARNDILYFLHADTTPPDNYAHSILEAVSEGHRAGCFRMQFDYDHWLLRFFGWFSRINHPICRGGDQSLFITKDLFNKMGGYNEDYIIYEDCELTGRLYRQADFTVLPSAVITSARKYRKQGVWKLQFHFGMIHFKRWLGAGPEQLYAYYKKNIAAG